MKNTLIILFAILSTTSCINETNHDLIVNKWYFESIKNNDDVDVKPVQEGDFMDVKADNSFYYTLGKAGVEALGTWEMIGDTSIVYIYNSKSKPDEKVIRTYKVAEINFDKLILFENGISYSFKNK